MPRIVVTGVVSVALPALTHEEVKATDIGAVAGEPFIHTSAFTLLVP